MLLYCMNAFCNDRLNKKKNFASIGRVLEHVSLDGCTRTETLYYILPYGTVLYCNIVLLLFFFA